jgi:sorting nexin-4
MNAKSQVFDSLSDVLINAFAKVKSRNEKFISIEQQVSKFDQNLTLVEKPHSKLLKSLHDISSNYEELAQAVLSLAAMETQITEPLESFSNRLPNYASLVREHAVDHGYRFVGPLTEYTAYCQSAKNLLRLRDQKQIDHEELQTWLSNNSAARDRTMSTGRGLGIAGFIQDKINDFKGVDPESVRKSRLGQLDEKIGQLKEAVQNGHETEKLFSEQVEKEFELFSNYKQEDFSRYFSDYAASQIQFHKKVHLLTQSLEFWDSIYPTLEKISL